MTRLTKCLLVTMWLARVALAQDASDFPPPPMVTLEESEQPALPPGQPDAQGLVQPPAVANAPYEQVVAEEARAKTEEPPGRGLRIAMGLLFGGALGAAGGVAGGFAGQATLPDSALQPVGATWAGAGIGFSIAAPIGVLLSGWLFDGDGSGWATLLGDLVGAGIGAAAVLFGGPEGTPLLFALPLAGSVVGYEVTSPAAKSQVLVSATFAPSRDGGVTVGLSGRF
ncbi:MAG: hypothetical protein AB1730_14810 [Myxococcota bacterium]